MGVGNSNIFRTSLGRGIASTGRGIGVASSNLFSATSKDSIASFEGDLAVGNSNVCSETSAMGVAGAGRSLCGNENAFITSSEGKFADSGETTSVGGPSNSCECFAALEDEAVGGGNFCSCDSIK